MLEPGQLVLTLYPRTATPGVVMAVAAGRLISRRRNGSWLLSVNVAGNHMSQLYWADELAPATAELAAEHRLCVPCLGYGLTDANKGEGTLCHNCMGSGHQAFFSTVTRDETTRITQITISERGDTA